MDGERATSDAKVVFVFSECLAIPFCFNATDHLMSGDLGKALLGYCVGIPAAIAGFSYSHWIKRLPEGVPSWISREGWKWWVPITVIGLFIYFIGPELYRRATFPLGTRTATSATSQAVSQPKTTPWVKDPYIEWDGTDNVIFGATALRSGENLHIYLDIRQSFSGGFPSPNELSGETAREPRVEIGFVPYFARDQILKVTLATVLKEPGNQTVFQWGDASFKNSGVGVNYSGYIGRIVLIGPDNKEEYYYFIVAGRSFRDNQSGTEVVGPPLIIDPSISDTIENWDEDAVP